MTRVLPQIKGPKYICGFTILFFLLFFATFCFAESTATSKWNISADKITRFENPESIVAEGNIVLEKREKKPPKPPKKDTTVSDWAELLEEEVIVEEVTPEDIENAPKARFVTKVTIKADWIAYDIEKQSIKARGNVSVISGDDKLFADQAQIDLQNETGSFTEAMIIRKEHELHLEGKEIKKTGVKSYYVEDGWVITCKVKEGETPPWSFSSSETTIEQGGYAFLKHAKFNIKDVPVFYTPYMVIPVKNTRQTGLLFPELSNSSRDGIGFNLPFFWDISDSVDLTILPEYFSKRGFMPSAEFRYALSTANKGALMGTFLDDKLSDPSETEYYADTNFTHTNSDRYWLRGKADHDFSNNWIARVDIDIASDEDYLTEFRSGLSGFNKSQYQFLSTFGRGFQNQSSLERKNTLKLLKSWSYSSLNVNFLAINDIRQVESSPTPLWKLPSLDYTGAIPIGESDFTFDWDADYVNYWRENGVGGHRIDLFPRLSTPVPLGPYLESRAEVGVRETLYAIETYGDGEWTQDNSPDRLLYTIHTDVATTLVRDYNLSGEDYSTLSHSIRPYIMYDFIPDVNQTDLPDFDKVDEDKWTNAITYGLDTFFELFEWGKDGKEEHSRQYSYIKIQQSYDLRSDYSDVPLSPITMKLGWKPMEKLDIYYKTEYPMGYDNSDYPSTVDEDDIDNYTTHTFSTSFINSRNDLFGFEYRYNEEEETEQINAYLKAQLLSNVQAAFNIEHSLSEEETNDANLSLTYLARCWSVTLKTSYTPTDKRIIIAFDLANIGSPVELNL